MASPNIIQPTSITLKQIAKTVGTSAVTLLTCDAGKSVKVSTLLCSNVTATAASFTLRISDGTATHAMYSTFVVGANDSKLAVSRDYPVYLEEGSSLQAIAGATGSINIVGAYELIG